MTSPTDIDALVRGLTKAQRESIMCATDMMSDHGGFPFFTARITPDPWPEGVAQFLTLHSDRLTPLGLAIRQALMEKKGG